MLIFWYGGKVQTLSDNCCENFTVNRMEMMTNKWLAAAMSQCGRVSMVFLCFLNSWHFVYAPSFRLFCTSINRCGCLGYNIPWSSWVLKTCFETSLIDVLSVSWRIDYNVHSYGMMSYIPQNISNRTLFYVFLLFFFITDLSKSAISLLASWWF